MSKLITPGRIIFSVGIMALGVLQFFTKEFIVSRPPSPSWLAEVPGKTAWAYISGVLLILSGLLILLRIKEKQATLFVGILILVAAFFLRHLPDMVGDNLEGIIWRINAYKAFVFFGGALIIAASFLREENKSNKILASNRLITTGWVLLSFFLIMCGAAHFKFDEFVPALIPTYIPAHTFWTYFAGVALLAGGIGLIFKQTRKWAAALTGSMILLWFILLHMPRALTSPDDYGEWMGVCESFTFSGIFFVLAGVSSGKKIVSQSTILSKREEVSV